MGVVFLIMVPMVFLLKDPKKHGAPKAKGTSQPSAEQEPAEFIHA
jgi:hypothetical protein